ncbi:unnamed protein product, partial [Brassicogethes aeneus]
MGPLLFLLYINNLFRVKTEEKLLSFADDTTVFYKGTTWESLKTNIEKDFVSIKNWFDHNLLTLNVEKTNFMAFGSYVKSLPQYDTLNFNQFSIKICKTAKFLGITLDPHLRCLISYFKLLKPILSIPQLHTVYDALVESHLRYGILGWGGVYKSILRDLEVAQKRILKIIQGVEITYPTDDLFQESRKMDCRQLYYLNLLLRMFHEKKGF